ncbi:SprT-like domain-containing protein [Chlamydiifrater phoenicopteri]|uniref:SprT-like domain-containing protein n=1 Tax=Chlamydiifrater phoenicopteri TaxID=2681469 RepID=UPI001BCC2FA3|nr:SprT-like domain-containing protein [Chlamydiifrater phoenicopteri]
MKSSELFIRKIRSLVTEPVRVRTHRGVSTLFSFCVRKRILSLQEKLLSAPLWAAEIIADFIKGKKLCRKIKKRLEEYVFSKPALIPLDTSPGKVHNLDELYQRVNEEYFGGELRFRIGWFGRILGRTRNSITLGTFHSEEKMIRIHRSLDRKEVPSFFLEFVIYHEMVHGVVGASKGSSGRRNVHSTAFREREKLFKKYQEAVAWEKQHQHILLMS